MYSTRSFDRICVIIDKRTQASKRITSMKIFLSLLSYLCLKSLVIERKCVKTCYFPNFNLCISKISFRMTSNAYRYLVENGHCKRWTWKYMRLTDELIVYKHFFLAIRKPMRFVTTTCCNRFYLANSILPYHAKNGMD